MQVMNVKEEKVMVYFTSSSSLYVVEYHHSLKVAHKLMLSQSHSVTGVDP